MTMGAQRGFTPKLVSAPYVDLGQPWPATSDVQRLPGNPDGSRNGASYKMQRSLSMQMRMVARSVLMDKQTALAAGLATPPPSPLSLVLPASPARPRHQDRHDQTANGCFRIRCPASRYL
jgi:hypothetical protein